MEKSASSTDRIEKRIVLRASRERVWRAISDSKEFGTWFGMTFEGPFVAGQPIRGAIAMTQVDDEIAAAQKPHVGLAFEIVIDAIEPQTLFAFRWHPYAVDKNVDYSSEPMTRVAFELLDAPASEGKGILLVLTESGFDQIPLARRAEAFTANDGGWTAQTKLIAAYLARFA